MKSCNSDAYKAFRKEFNRSINDSSALGDCIATVLSIQKYYLSNVDKRKLIEKAEKESDSEIPKAKSTKSTIEKPRAKRKKAQTKDSDAKVEAKKESKDQKATVKESFTEAEGQGGPDRGRARCIGF